MAVAVGAGVWVAVAVGSGVADGTSVGVGVFVGTATVTGSTVGVGSSVWQANPNHASSRAAVKVAARKERFGFNGLPV